MRKQYEYAGKTMKVKETGEAFRVEDWCENVLGRSWMNANGHPAALQYAVRTATNDIPIDNEVVYGKLGMYGMLFHVSELEALA